MREKGELVIDCIRALLRLVGSCYLLVTGYWLAFAVLFGIPVGLTVGAFAVAGEPMPQWLFLAVVTAAWSGLSGALIGGLGEVLQRRG